MRLSFTFKPTQCEQQTVSESSENQIAVQVDIPSVVGVPFIVLFLGYIMLWVSTWHGIDGDFFLFIGPASLVTLLTVVAFYRRQIFSNANLMLFYSFVFVCAFPIAREATHIDIVQVPCTMTVFALAIGMFAWAVRLKLCRKNDDQTKNT